MEKIVLLDCDCVQTGEINWLSSKPDTSVIAVSNNPKRLPTVDNVRVGWRVPVFHNSADFLLISLLTDALNQLKQADTEKPVVAIVTHDKALARGVRLVTKRKKTRFKRFSTLKELDEGLSEL
ncbi:hypothetical protein BIZ37_04010 [Photobacterium sp. BZF1]|uniref:hypothetical protein n=1 Tax=Photobacterium sp. BZF1 TaxID=1904457 RepID=UPI001653C846|nr:hypothetical protein [Photobacterium sp. BZF1]MBC7001714.1 hypothetical protein [Photobacterium sp. BZF1]